jgi:hypothetical protein
MIALQIYKFEQESIYFLKGSNDRLCALRKSFNKLVGRRITEIPVE